MSLLRWIGLFLFLGCGACSGDDRFEKAAFQYRVDSAVNTRLDSVQLRLQRRNDSAIEAAAQRRADSLRLQKAPTPARPADTSRPPAIPASTP